MRCLTLAKALLGATFLVAGSTETAPAALPSATNLPPHPRLLFTREKLPEIRERIARQAWARELFADRRKEADAWLDRQVVLPPRGSQWYHYYSCPKHGARLRTESPTRHVCPVDGEAFTGYPYDDVVLAGDHSRLAAAVKTLGLIHQIEGGTRHAAKAREILLAYAARYQGYPLHNIRGEAKVGGGKVGPQTLDESVWLIAMVEGADLVWSSLSAEDQRQIAEGLIRPAVEIIRQHRMGIHNIQCWKNSAVGLAGLLLGDMTLVDEALNGESGYFNQMAKGVSPDGPWYEGAWGYHFYTLSALAHLTEGAFHSGIDLYGPALKRMFDAPIEMAMPDLVLPAFNDSHTVNLAGSAGLYETAYARYKDPRQATVAALGRRRSDSALLHGASLPPGSPPPPVSRNFTASGNAILAAGTGRDSAWLCLDYGPHGGGHGHPDKLGFVLYGLGKVLAPDPGTANYGVPIQAAWFRATLAHNTLTVDEKSQQAAEGRCEAFLATNGLSAAMARAGRIHEDATFVRTVALIGDRWFVFIDQVRAQREHTFDLAYHNVGRVAAPSAARPSTAPDKPGYSCLRDLRALDSTEGLSLDFDVGGGQKARWAMAGGEPTTYLTGTGVGAHTEDRVPVVIARRRARQATYLWGLGLGNAAGPIEIEPEATGSGAAAARLRTPAGTWGILANPEGIEVRAFGQPTQARLAFFEQDSQGKWALRHFQR